MSGCGQTHNATTTVPAQELFLPLVCAILYAVTFTQSFIHYIGDH